MKTKRPFSFVLYFIFIALFWTFPLSPKDIFEIQNNKFVQISFCRSAFADDTDSIYVVCDEWKNYTNSDETGAYWEIIKTVFEPLGIEVKTQVMPWKRAKYFVTEKQADALIGDYFEENSSYFLFPKWHISVEDPVVAFFKKGHFNDWENTGIRSLEGKKAVWIRGYDFDKHFLQDINIFKHEISTIAQGLQLIAVGRDDVFLDYESGIRQEAKNLNIDLEKDYEIKVANPGSKLYVAFAKTDRSKELVQIFDSRMARLAESGEIDKIYMKWGLGADKFAKERFNEK